MKTQYPKCSVLDLAVKNKVINGAKIGSVDRPELFFPENEACCDCKSKVILVFTLLKRKENYFTC